MANHVGSTSPMRDLSGTIFFASIIEKEMCRVLDTGATYHMVYSDDLLTTNSHITNQIVHLPKKATATDTHIGIIHFTGFVLHGVPCVPSFKLNLISVRKLFHNSNYLATFTNSTCMLQDQRSGR